MSDEAKIDFLPAQPGIMQAVREKELLLAGETSFPKIAAKDVKQDDLCYVVFPVVKDGVAVNWGYLGKAASVSDKEAKFVLAEAHQLTGAIQDDEHAAWELDVEHYSDTIFLISRAAASADGREAPIGSLPLPPLTAEKRDKIMAKNGQFKRFSSGAQVNLQRMEVLRVAVQAGYEGSDGVPLQDGDATNYFEEAKQAKVDELESLAGEEKSPPALNIGQIDTNVSIVKNVVNELLKSLASREHAAPKSSRPRRI